MKKLTLICEAQTFPLEVGEKDSCLQVSLSGEPMNLNVGNRHEGGLSLMLDDCSYEVPVQIRDSQIVVEVEGERFVFEVDDGASVGKGAGRGARGGHAEIKAPMPGKVVKLLVSPGDTVEAGQGVLLFEAMKMQNEIRSPVAGEVTDLVVSEGQAVEMREKLLSVQGS